MQMLPSTEELVKPAVRISHKYLLKLDIMVSPAGFEPATY